VFFFAARCRTEGKNLPREAENAFPPVIILLILMDKIIGTAIANYEP
jgi:hypothetical protein